MYLNLANNQIVLLNLSEIPKDIAILKIGGNPCTEDVSYRKEVINCFLECNESHPYAIFQLVLNFGLFIKMV